MKSISDFKKQVVTGQKIKLYKTNNINRLQKDKKNDFQNM